VRHTPYFIDRVADREGKELFSNAPKGERVLPADTARVATQILSQVVQRGTGRAAGIPRWQVAGKTGSSANNTNSWFVGFTTTLATAVWMGSPDGDVPMRNVGGITVFGGTYPARIWHDYMAAALADVEPVGFPEPESYPGGSDYLSVPNEKSSSRDSGVDSGPRLAVPETVPSSPVQQAPVQNVPIPQFTIPTVPQFTIPPIPTLPPITIPDRPTRPGRD